MVRTKALRVGQDIEESILNDRLSLASRLTALADSASGYRSAKSPLWDGTVPIAVAGVMDALRFSKVDVSLGGSDVTHQEFVDALNRTHVDPQTLQDHVVERARGGFIAVRGAYFENHLVEGIRDRTIPLPKGVDHVQLNSFTHPGSDLTMFGDHGQVIVEANAKAASSAAVILEHFERYPDVPVVYATTEAAQDAARHGIRVIGSGTKSFILDGHPTVIDIGETAASYDQQLHALASGHHESFLHFFGAHDLLSHIPWISGGVIAFRMFRRYQAGMERADNLQQLGRESARSASALAVGGILQHAGVPIPVTVIGTLCAASAAQGAFDVRDSWSMLSAQETLISQRAQSLLLL